MLSQPVANPHRRSVTTNRPTFAQRWQWRFDHTNPGLLRKSRAHFAPKVPRPCSEKQFFDKNRALQCRAVFIDIEGRNRGNRHPSLATPGATATFPEETQGFAPESVFTPEFTRSGAVTLLYFSHTRTTLARYVVDIWSHDHDDDDDGEDHLMTWWKDWLDIRPQPGSSRTKLRLKRKYCTHCTLTDGLVLYFFYRSPLCYAFSLVLSCVCSVVSVFVMACCHTISHFHSSLPACHWYDYYHYYISDFFSQYSIRVRFYHNFMLLHIIFVGFGMTCSHLKIANHFAASYLGLSENWVPPNAVVYHQTGPFDGLFGSIIYQMQDSSESINLGLYVCGYPWDHWWNDGQLFGWLSNHHGTRKALTEHSCCVVRQRIHHLPRRFLPWHTISLETAAWVAGNLVFFGQISCGSAGWLDVEDFHS